MVEPLRRAGLFAQAAVLAALVEMGIRVWPLPRICRWLGIPLVVDAPVSVPRTRPLPRHVRPHWEAGHAVMFRWPGGDTCLRRSLVQAVMLRRLHPVMRLGWRQHPTAPVAHAWLEVDGESLDGDMAGILAWKRTA